MFKLKRIIYIVVGLCFVILLFIYKIYNLVQSQRLKTYTTPIDYNRTPVLQYNGTEEYLINTTGCYIPNYSKTLHFIEAINTHNSCGERAVHIEKTLDDVIEFVVDTDKINRHLKGSQNFSCCYQFAHRSTAEGKEDSDLIYSSCEVFQNKSTAILKEEIITVTCVIQPSKKVIYEDSYIVLKRINKNNNKTASSEETKNSWNVLLLGMDTMSRARYIATMPQTVRYMREHEWLDYRGYQKVGYNTYPNIMSVLTGKNMSTVYGACKEGMHQCRELMIWTKFREAGFVTAYGEDFLQLPDTFYRYKGFKTPPTDHYMRPFFLTGEKRNGNLICAKQMPSALHLLNYAFEFSNTYKNDNFFGMFWLNSYSHNIENLPSLIDKDMTEFFEKLDSAGILNNTFIFFFSDHGIRYGDMRVPMESYYEERLPMFFIWIPPKFRDSHQKEYHSLQINQDRLTTPYDFHMTLWSILKITNTSVGIIRSEACLQCGCLFEEKYLNRTCAEASVSPKWCSCHDMATVDQNESDAKLSLQLAVTYIQNKTNSIETTACQACTPLKLKTQLRNHAYKSDITNNTYYVVAFVMEPGNVAYEATVEKDDTKFNIIHPTDTISPYNTRGSCVKNPNDRAYCVCMAEKSCNKKGKR